MLARMASFHGGSGLVRLSGYEYFGNFGKALFTMFQVLTGESWSEAALRWESAEDFRNPTQAIGVSFFFVSFNLVNGIVLINVAIAVLLEKMVDDESDKHPPAVTQDACSLGRESGPRATGSIEPSESTLGPVAFDEVQAFTDDDYDKDFLSLRTDMAKIKLQMSQLLTVLHAATWLDFKTHIAALVQAGKLREAFRCWVSVVEIIHAPWVSPSLGEFDELPPLRRAACGEFPCDRCATRRGGFKFPWIGTWTSRGVFVPHGANPMEAWAHFQRNTAKLDLILLAMYSSPLEADDVCPQEMYGLQLRPQVHPDRPGLADSVELFAYWRVWLGALGGSRRVGPLRLCSHSLPGGDPGRCGDLVPTEHTGRWWAGWVPSKLEASRPCWLDPVLDVATQPGDHASSVALACAASAMVPGTSVRAVGFGPKHGSWKLECTPHSDSSQHVFALRTLAAVSGCFAMAHGGGYYAQAASSSSGGDPEGGWNAAEALQQIAASRARQRREREGFTRDEDFAFAFVDFDHAVGTAGHHVADEWLAARARVNEGLLHAGAQVAEGRPLPVRSLKPARKTILKHKARTMAVAKPADAKVARRVQHLTSMFVGMGSFKPAGILTDSRRSEWKQTCERIAQQKVRAAEPATMDRVVNTWLELKQWLEIRGLSAAPGTVDLDHFMQSASAPARAMQALRWMNKHAQLDMDLGNVTVPAVPRAAAGPKGQAPVAEPVLIPILEDRVKELHDLGDERWSALLAPWVICFGMVRYAHVMRTEPIKLTGAFLHCRCSRGKQHQHRSGFDYAIPGTFLNGFPWSRELMELYRTLAPAKQKSCGLCFSDEGKPWSIHEIQQTMRAELGLHVENVETMTTYSWRRVSPTFGQLLRFSDQELSALGDWQEKKDMPAEGQMALHYSSAKYAASLKVKAMIWGATPVVAEHLSWEAIPEDDLASAKAAGAQAVDRLTRADRQPLWAASGNFQDVQKRLKLSKTYVEKAAAARARAAAPAGPTMPIIPSLGRPRLCPKEELPSHLIPAAIGPKVATRKRNINLQEAKVEVMEDRKRARTGEVAQPKTPPKAKAMPKGGAAQPVTPPKAAAVAPAEEAMDRRLEQLGVGGGKTAQAPTIIWESVRGGRLYLSGLPTRATAAQFPEVALQVCCFLGGPECRQGVTLRGAQLMTFSAAYASQRSEQWRELWPAVQHTLFAGDSVLMRCMKGKHRAAFTGILTRALLAGETIDEANRHVESLRDTELRKVTRERGMAQWLRQTWRDSQLVTPMPLPAAYAATEHSNIHVMTAEGVTLCRHKQADGKTKRLVNPMTTTDVYEATAWSRPWCDGCLRRCPASWWPPQ
eukprot:Skav233042  [mRNA]  locus=scaffold909:1189508:1199209:- [translate_table: standard]